MFGRIVLGSHLAPGSCLLGDFWWLLQSPYWLWVCSGFLFLPGSVVVVYMCLGMHPFLPDCQICWRRVAPLCSYNCLYFFGVGCDLSFFIHDFIYLGPFSFLFDKSGQGFINLINSFKEPVPHFIDLFYCSFGFYFIDFCSDLYYFSSPAGVRLYLLFFLQLL